MKNRSFQAYFGNSDLSFTLFRVSLFVLSPRGDVEFCDTALRASFLLRCENLEMRRAVLQLPVRLHHRRVSDALAWCNLLDDYRGGDGDVLVVRGFHHCRTYAVERSRGVVVYLHRDACQFAGTERRAVPHVSHVSYLQRRHPCLLHHQRCGVRLAV